MTRTVDFEVIRAETALGEPLEVRSGDDVFHVHPEMPWEFAVAWDARRVDDAIASIVPGDECEGFRTMVFADKPSLDTALNRIVAIWAMESGESSASSRSSKTAGTRSRPTSKRTTT